MKLSISTIYSIRILQYLHLAQEAKASPPTATMLSREIGISYPLFMKLAGQLRRSGLIRIGLGRNSAYVLNKSASKISVYDVYLATEGELQLNPCDDDEMVPRIQGDEGHCGLHSFLSDIEKIMIARMKAQSIKDLDKDLVFSINMKQRLPIQNENVANREVGQGRCFRVPTADEKDRLIPFDEILLFKAGVRANMLELHTKNEAFRAQGRIQKVAEIGPEFIQIHPQYTVNINHIKNFDRAKGRIQLSDGRIIPVANYKVAALLGHLATHQQDMQSA